MGQTVNLLAYAFGGSNPSLPTANCYRFILNDQCETVFFMPLGKADIPSRSSKPRRMPPLSGHIFRFAETSPPFSRLIFHFPKPSHFYLGLLQKDVGLLQKDKAHLKKDVAHPQKDVRLLPKNTGHLSVSSR